MKITFEINTQYLTNSDVTKITEYFTTNLLSMQSFYENDVLTNMEGISSCPFGKLDMNFTIQVDPNLEDALTDEEYDKVMRGIQL